MLSITPVVFVVLSIAFVLLAAHPFLTYPLSLDVVRRLRPPRTVRPRAQRQPTFAICMSAFNEAAVIEEKARNLISLAETVARCELLIYVDGATDNTAALLEPYRGQIEVVVATERRGKSHGLDVLVGRTRADVIVFTDANVTLDIDVLRRIGPWFDDPTVGCVCGHLRYANADESAIADSGSLYWRLEEYIKQLESDTFGVIGADGSLFAIRRTLHQAVPPDIIDDFYVSMKILLAGYRVVREPDALALERSATAASEEFWRKARIACQALNVHRVIWHDVKRSGPLLYCYLSHRLLKWLMVYNLALCGFFLLAALLCTLPAKAVLAAVLVPGVIAGAGFLAGIKPLHRLFAIVVSFAGVGWGVWRSLRGDRFQTWNPPLSARSVTSGLASLEPRRRS
jgi:cellulose synthase/poly-beta-1,6-N-acetylglucosamine synthase-like glycosyltransferase